MVNSKTDLNTHACVLQDSSLLPSTFGQYKWKIISTQSFKSSFCRNLQSELYVNWQKEERLLIAGGMTVIMRMLGRLDTGEQNVSHRLVQISLSLTPQGSPQPARGPAGSTANTVNTSNSYRTGNSVLGTPGCATDSWLRNHCDGELHASRLWSSPKSGQRVALENLRRDDKDRTKAWILEFNQEEKGDTSFDKGTRASVWQNEVAVRATLAIFFKWQY